MHTLPAGAPATLSEAFRYIGSCESPSIDHLKVMVMLEAAGKTLYDQMAEGVEHVEVKALLQWTGRDEFAHAQRVSRAIGVLTGEAYPVPSAEENPYLATPPPRRPVTRDSLTRLADAEEGGEQLYERWAAHCTSEQAAALFRENGREEFGHGGRLRQAAQLLPTAVV